MQSFFQMQPSPSQMQSTAGYLFTLFASFSAYKMLFRSVVDDVIPASVMSRVWSLLSRFFTPPSNQTTIVVDEQAGMSRNVVYESAEIYLGTKVSPSTDRFKVNKTPKQKNISISITKDQVILDTFKDVGKLEWRFVNEPANNEGHNHTPEKRYFELVFDKQHRDVVVDEYLPFVLERADAIRNSDKPVRLFTRDCPSYDDDYGYGGGNGMWGSVNLDHPSTFDKLAMEQDMKKALIQDLDRFVRRKDYYKSVGKAWKRGYLLYGPPGTGKSSLIAAIANYLKFDIYDLELTSLYSNSELRRIMLSTTNRSIIVIEDIDCSVEMHDREQEHDYTNPSNTKLTLSGLLNFIDGLWSCAGDERIIIFTTNHKEKLDPALLRPGRMDMHVHLSYCTPAGFRTLASNYQGIDREYNEKLFDEIEGMIESYEVTPAVIAEELMRSEDANAALEGVKILLNQKLAEKNAASAAAAEDKNGEDDGVPTASSSPEEEEEDEEDFGRMRKPPAFRRRFVGGFRGRRGRGRW